MVCHQERNPNLGRPAVLHCILTKSRGNSSLAQGKGMNVGAAWICACKVAIASLSLLQQPRGGALDTA